MSRIWTRAQKQAIESRNGTLLLSAAAGSGKTAVLVQRVIELISDEKKPVDIDKLLIVTFTKAAANEMKERISNALSKLIDDNPFDKHLQRQQLMLSRARICTIHSFCTQIIKANFEKLGVSADFRVADSNEMNVIRGEALQCIIDELYEEKSEDFLILSESFSKGRDDKILLETVETVYDFVRSYPCMDRWFKEKLRLFDVNEYNMRANIFIDTIIEYTKEAIDFCIDQTVYSLENIELDENIKKAYGEAFNNDLYMLNNLNATINSGDWQEIRKLINIFKDGMYKLKALRGYSDDPIKINVTNARSKVKKTIESLENLYVFSSDDILDDMKKLYPIVDKLFETVRRFSIKLDEMKAERKILDYSDLEQITLKLLVNSTDGGYKKTNDALRISKEFFEIMVDEYQDTNEVQDMIFKALSSNEENLFMVGDIKQSIYRFRQAMPEIFLAKKEAYKLYDKNLEDKKLKINLDKNFRSKNNIIEAVNYMFSVLMTKSVGEIDYNEDEKLKYAATYYNEDNKDDVSIKVLKLEHESKIDMDIAEAEYIGDIIADMIGKGYMVKDGDTERQVTYRDFCILLRSTKKHAAVFSQQLNLMGIPAWSERDGNFFNTPEISVMISFLRIIDNPIQDIALLSVLMSPIYNFSVDDAAKLRYENKNEAIYFSVVRAAQENTELGLKCKQFLKDIEMFTYLSASVTVDKLINIVYKKTRYTVLVQAMKNGSLRLANLRMLLDYARNYSVSGYRELSSFIRFIDKLQERKSDLNAASLISENANIVRVMSMHSSKGLEFPVCIIANCSRQFNKRKDSVVLNSKLSVGLKLRDDKYLNQYTTLSREAINIENEREQLSEELRVLYVAMTRARQKLIMITTLKSMDRINKLASNVRGKRKLEPYSVKSAQSFSDWILSSMLMHKGGAELRRIAGLNLNEVSIYDNDSDIEVEVVKREYKEDKDVDLLDVDVNLPVFEGYVGLNKDDIIKKIENRLNFVYKYKELEGISTKVTATKLSSEEFEGDYKLGSRPEFMNKNKLSGAKAGEALHKFLSIADLKRAKQDLEGEIKKLKSEEKLSKAQAKSIDKVSVGEFLNSQLYNRIINSDQLFREYRFSVELNLSDVYGEEFRGYEKETLILQGAVDCVFIEDGKAVIVDYKTDKYKDHDRLKERYSKQLKLYGEAVKQCLGIEVKEKIIYSLYLKDEIRV